MLRRRDGSGDARRHLTLLINVMLYPEGVSSDAVTLIIVIVRLSWSCWVMRRVVKCRAWIQCVEGRVTIFK